ncbi:MAG: hypothetical protein HY286_09550 [Planctomycetes bacterium]|nr:hypothetical protein [Planctomycetota bacterium]
MILIKLEQPVVAVLLFVLLQPIQSAAVAARADRSGLRDRVGKPADVASSAYLYRSDRPTEQNPPESWILLSQYTNVPFDKRIDTNAPAIKKVLCGLLWEEVRPIRRVELTWPSDERKPAPDDLQLSYFDGTDDAAHTWWNPRSVLQADKPAVSSDGKTYIYTIPSATWGVVASLRGDGGASNYTVPSMRALVPDPWKQLEIEIEWGFAAATEALAYDGELEMYDGVVGPLQSLQNDPETTITGPRAWRSAANKTAGGRRGVRCNILYIGSSRWRRVWPYLAQPEDVARTILTLRTSNGSFSFLASDLEQGPIYASEYGFFVRAVSGPVNSNVVNPPANLAAPGMQLLNEKAETVPGVPLIRGWASRTIPCVAANPTIETGVSGSLVIPPRCVVAHPTPDRDVLIVWRSPIEGLVSVAGKVMMADAAGGNGVEWSLVRDVNGNINDARTVLAHGAVGTGGSQSFRPGSDAEKSSDVLVHAGDLLSLVINAKDKNHICDTTIVELCITELGGQKRRWNLGDDVIDNILKGNPLADAHGNAIVWSFCSAAVPDAPPAPSEPPFPLQSKASSAREFVAELASRKLKTIRERVREHSEQTWEGAVGAMITNKPPPAIPAPPFEPPFTIEVPSSQLTAQWKLCASHILRRSVQDAGGKWNFNDYPFGILASETFMILRALDLQGMHGAAADGLDQWLKLPTWPRVVPGENGHHALARPDRPLGNFSDGNGAFTHAEGPVGWGGNMDGIHAMGPGAIVYAIAEHFKFTGDVAWLKSNINRIVANAEWILRQRQLLIDNIPNGRNLWSRGLQPAQVVTPDSMSMHMQFYESEAYYWMAVKQTAELLAFVDPGAGKKMEAEAEKYRIDLLAAIDRSLILTPVVQVRDGTYRSFIPFAPYVRGFAAGAWGWLRCQGHVGAIYWDTVQSADPLVSPSGLLSPHDPRVQGHLDVLEDRLLLENTHVHERTSGFDAERDWFSHASWQYQCGLERHANIHLAADDAPNFVRSFLNQYAVDIMPGEYTFREHTVAGPPDKIYEESCFLDRFRQMLIMEAGDALWIARATPRAWCENGKKIIVHNAPSHFGPVSYEIRSEIDKGTITAAIDLPSRRPPAAVLLRLRHPNSNRMKSVTVNGGVWTDFDPAKEIVRLTGLAGSATVEVSY